MLNGLDVEDEPHEQTGRDGAGVDSCQRRAYPGGATARQDNRWNRHGQAAAAKPIAQGRDKLCEQTSDITGVKATALFTDIDAHIGERIIVIALDRIWNQASGRLFR